MKKSLFRWQIAGFIFTSIVGTLLHFLYDWSNQAFLFALFSAINESIWEHMKLLFFPMFLFAWIESNFLEKEYENFWQIKLIGLLSGVLLIPIFYYSYTGIFGIFIDWINIAIFFITVAISYLIETHLFKYKTTNFLSLQIALILLCFLAFLFVIFTFVPPHIPLFQDPITKLYGIQ